MVEILDLWSPHKLLKNLGALSGYAKCSQSSIKIKKLKSLLSFLDTMENSRKKPISRYCPFKRVGVFLPHATAETAYTAALQAAGTPGAHRHLGLRVRQRGHHLTTLTTRSQLTAATHNQGTLGVCSARCEARTIP
jgi:hypothetical protein